MIQGWVNQMEMHCKFIKFGSSSSYMHTGPSSLFYMLSNEKYWDITNSNHLSTKLKSIAEWVGPDPTTSRLRNPDKNSRA